MSPADQLPAQIADALQALGERDNVHISVHYHNTCKDNRWQVVETRPMADHAFEHEAKSGTGPTYADALAACRAATFSGGKDA